jgi:hypothetical protein
MAMRVTSEFENEPLIAMNPAASFTEPHDGGSPAILERLDAVDEELLQVVLTDARQARTPKPRRRAAR